MEDSVKVVLTGGMGTGKTSIIKALMYNTFSENYVSSEGGECGKYKFVYEEMNNHQLTMDIWDTAGQEKFRALTKIFYKNAEIAILVYDITKEKTFKELQTYWISQLHEAGLKGIILGLAGNKSDLYDNEQIKEEDAKDFANEINATFYQTSAYLNNGIRELFKQLGLRYLQKKYPDQIDNNNTNHKQNNNKKNILLDKNKSTSQKKDSRCCK